MEGSGLLEEQTKPFFGKQGLLISIELRDLRPLPKLIIPLPHISYLKPQASSLIPHDKSKMTKAVNEPPTKMDEYQRRPLPFYF